MEYVTITVDELNRSEDYPVGDAWNAIQGYVSQGYTVTVASCDEEEEE